MIRPWLSRLSARLRPRRGRGVVRTPTVLQMEAVECGAASLAMILAYHGRIVPLAELRRECGVSRDGSKASNLTKAARRYGLVAKGFKKEPAALREIAPPFVVFWNFNHFLVVDGFHGDVVHLDDPAVGRRTVTFKEFDESYTGVALVFEPGPGFERGGRAPSVARSLATRLRGSWAPLAYCVIAGAILVVPGLLAPAFSKVFVDRVLVERKADWLRPLLAGIVAAAALKAVVQHLELLYLRRLAVRLSAGMSGRFLWHLLRLPVGFYAQRFAGEIGNRVQLNDKVAQLLSGKLAQTAIDVVMLVFYGAVILAYDPVLGAVALAFVLASLLALRFVAERRIDAQQRLGQEIGKAEGVAIAGLLGMETIKAAAQEGAFFQRWAGYYTKALGASQEAGVSSMNLGVLPSFLSSLSTLALLALGGLRV
ncbi:MAG TPA: cysteine peptidase family C39 domain-containing protein, partial [Planctomycetota bacterium]|nr:cysteine peptidase family C39 domain-containing protein [Planctomycetota bacterium]